MGRRLLKDYILLSRLHKPIGIWLLLFPGLVGLSISNQMIPYSYWGIFIIGAVVMRSAGCIYNDIIDRPFDGGVLRTKERPLVRIKDPLSLNWALIFLISNLIIGLMCLIQFNFLTIIIGIVTAVMIIVYPWMKRITYWPQLFLGFTMNMGFLMGCIANKASLNRSQFLMYLGMVSWTLGYDTIYGFQDMEDDATIGIKSTTFIAKKYVRMFLTIPYAVTLMCWLSAGLVGGIESFYYIVLAVIALILAWQVLTLNILNSSNCLTRFKSNQWVGILLLVGILLSKM